MPPNGTLIRQRVTQSDVARVAGVHNTTVSLSLRNCPSIPEATRKRIRSIADEMGYYPDPTLQALVAYRKGRLSNRPRETMAYLTNWGTRWGWRTIPLHERAYVGALRKAAELGYQLEHFWLGEPGMNQRCMSNMLYHRGITGVLIAAHREGSRELSEMDWPRLSAVKIGLFPNTPAIHRVIDGQSGTIGLAMRRIWASGFKRVGLVMGPGDCTANTAWLAGFLVEQGSLPDDDRIPVFRNDRCDREPASETQDPFSPDELAALGKWFRDYRPEVIVGSSPGVLGMIGQLRLVVPRDVAYVDLCREGADHGIAGVRQNGEIAGEVAASMLVGQLQHNVRGVPDVGTSTMVDATWIDGATLPLSRAPVPRLETLRVRGRLIESAALATA
jgi:LacI family transcriptional regulator